jgi:general secretion pathway protein D
LKTGPLKTSADFRDAGKLMLHFWRQLLALTCLSVGFNIFAGAQDPSIETVSYAIRYCDPQQVLTAVQPLLNNAADVEIRGDQAGHRVVLTGPDWAHELLNLVIRRVDQPPGAQPANGNGSGNRTLGPPRASGTRVTPGADRGAALAPSPSVNSADSIRRLYSLRPGTGAEVRRSLQQLFTEKLQPIPGAINAWEIKTRTGTKLVVQLDLAREDVLVESTPIVVEEFLKLLQAQNQSVVQSPLGQLAVRVTGANRGTQQQVTAILGTAKQLASAADVSGTIGDGLAATDRRLTETRLPDVSLRGPFRMAAAQGPVSTPPIQESPAGDEMLKLPATLPQFQDVEVEQLPELDAIILRGRDGDLQQLTEIIRELEKLSRETQPAARVVPLRFARSEQIAEVLVKTQPELTGGRQGSAQVLPLNKPNALLLYGWGEAVTALEELIEKLDRPVSPESQFRVFVLRRARATDVQQTMQSFFASRTGSLAPQIESTVDNRTNALIVHAAPRDMAEVVRLVDQLDVHSSGIVQQTRVFEIRNGLAADVAETLEDALANPAATQGGAVMELLTNRDEGKRILSGVLEGLQITVNARNNSLIISAPAENFELIEALIEQIDTRRATAKIKIFPIINSDAASLIETLRSLLPSQPGEATPASEQLPSRAGETALVPLRFTVDVRSNSVIASGSEGDLMIVEALVTRLDEADAMQRKNSVYHLKNAPAVDVALTINEFLRSRRQVELAAPGSINPFQQLEREVVVVPEPVSNKLVLSATPRYFEEISQLIEKLDEQPPQVMIQVLIAEVSLDNAEEFGIELGLQDSVLFDRSLLGDLVSLTETNQSSTPAGILTQTNQNIIGASNTPGFNFNSIQDLGNSGSNRAINSAGAVGGQGLSNFDLGRGNAELGFGGLVLSASSQNVSMLLRALEESRRMQVLSRPQVLTLDNQPAFIQVGQRVPRIVGSSINQIGQQNEIALENVGLILGVTPRISPEGNVVMEIDAEKSSIGPDSEGIPVSVSADGTVIRSPRVDVTSAQATVSAADGETIILGGLITTSDREVHRKVPFLGDVPVIKHLFRFDSIQTRRAELIIVLTPRVVRSAGDMERLKQVELARMSWCAADVFDLHPDAFSEPLAHATFEEDGDWDVVYPHTDPRGQRLQSLGTPLGAGLDPAFMGPQMQAPDVQSADPMRIPSANPPSPEMLPPPPVPNEFLGVPSGARR